MSEKQVWVIRTADVETGAKVRERSLAAIGWPALGDLSQYRDRDALKEALRNSYPDRSEPTIRVYASVLYRFVHELSPGDYVLTPLRSSREILVGTVAGPYKHDPSAVSASYPNVRPVEWRDQTISRDQLPENLRNGLGAIVTLFCLTAYREALEMIFSGGAPPKEEEPVPPFYEDTRAKADALIQDRLSALDWSQFQELVAGVLAAAGYKSRVSPAGPDRGVDIVAHPDRFGFEEPVVKVQVKHRKGAASAPEVRSFVGSLRERECGLFVSTGGFTTDALREPDRTSRRLMLIDGEEFVDMLLEYYEKLNPEIQALVPLRKVYIPYKVED